MSLERGGVWLKGTWAEPSSKTAPSPWVSCVLRAQAHSAAAGAASVARGEGPEACDGGAGYSSMCKTPQPCGTSMWHVHPRFTDKATGLVRFAAEGRVGGRCSFTPLSDSHPSLPCSMAKSHTGTTSPASGRLATPSGTPMWRWMASLSSGGMTSRKLRRLQRLEG